MAALRLAALAPVLLLAACATSAPTTTSYIENFHALPEGHRAGGCVEGLDEGAEIQASKAELTGRYSWAVPTRGAVDAIARFSSDDLIDFGAGTGYWGHLIQQRRPEIRIEAFDDWSWGRPEHLWLDVQTGGVEETRRAATARSTLMMVWPPRDDSALELLERWPGQRLVYVGELFRGSASLGFFEELLRHWDLVARLPLPNWYNRSDAVYLAVRGSGLGWEQLAADACADDRLWRDSVTRAGVDLPGRSGLVADQQ